MTPAEAADLLGVSVTAAPEEVLRAFRRSARASHPDLLVGATHSEIAAAEAQFVRVTAARDMLLKTPPDAPSTEVPHQGQWYTSPASGQRIFIAEPQPLPLPPSSWAIGAWVALLVVAVALSYLGGPLPQNPFDLVLRMIPLATFAVLYASTGRRRYLVLGLIWAGVTAVMTFVLASFGSLLALEILIVPLLALGIIGNRRRRRHGAEHTEQ